MKKKKKYIRYSKERVVLSDVLPYEVPIIFSNRYFYRFLGNNKIEKKANKILYKHFYNGDEDLAFREILKLLFDLSGISYSESEVDRRRCNKIPFNYKIAHKETDFRTLSVVHPFNQLWLVEFYERYKEQILYYSKISRFSIRKPDAVAKFVFFNDKLHDRNRGNQDDFLELQGKEYENLKSFFAYKKYTNIHRFYEDYRYQRAEKKFKILYKFDITKCFDSIYSHSIVWALINKDIVKDKLSDSKKTFAGKFDLLMQGTNYGETNGIIIGPEFSRIFAELILQQIDKYIENYLREAHSLYNRKDYEIYRYVDDYFLFCDTEITRNIIVKAFRHELKEFKMSLNDNKGKPYEKPMVTEISIAKQKINQLFEKEPRFKILENDNQSLDNTFEGEEVTIINKHVFKFHINPNKLALKFKTIIKDSHVEYKDVLNYTLAILNNKIEKIITRFEKQFKQYFELEQSHNISEDDLTKKKKLENNFTKFIIGYIDFVFFLYSVSPRVNSSIKLANILSKIINYYKGVYKIANTDNNSVRVYRMREMNRDLIFKKISDDISLILERNQMDRHTQIEGLYLIIVLKELGKNYRISQNQLARYFGCIDKMTGQISIKLEDSLNYYCIIVLLFYIKNIRIYNEFKEELKKYIKCYIGRIDEDKRKRTTESTLLIMDLMVCPYLTDDFKEELLRKYGVPSNLCLPVLSFKKNQKYWFTKWENFDLAKELNSKNSEDVYS